jgi:hypothetical protein
MYEAHVSGGQCDGDSGPYGGPSQRGDLDILAGGEISASIARMSIGGQGRIRIDPLNQNVQVAGSHP